MYLFNFKDVIQCVAETIKGGVRVDYLRLCIVSQTQLKKCLSFQEYFLSDSRRYPHVMGGLSV